MIDRFKMPENADPNRNALMRINPKDKFKRHVGLNPSEDSEFRSICKCGTDALVACYGDSDELYSAYDLWVMCRRCPNCRNKKDLFDPITNTIFDARRIEYVIQDFLDNERDNPEAYVYFVSDTLHMKIGVAENPKERLKQLQGGNPNKLEIKYLLPCKSEKAAYQAEKKLHWLYERYRLQGEWFNILDKIDHYSFELWFSPKSYLDVLSGNESA